MPLGIEVHIIPTALQSSNSMQDQFKMIKRVRAVLLAMQKGQMRGSTAADYLRKVQRLKHHGGGVFDGTIAEALKATKKLSWQGSRATLLHSENG